MFKAAGQNRVHSRSICRITNCDGIELYWNHLCRMMNHWRKFRLKETKFGNVMSRDCYLLISTFLHFTNNEQHVQHGEDGCKGWIHYSKFNQCWILTIHYMKLFMAQGKTCALMKAWSNSRGGFFFQVILVLCELDSGYGLKFEVYNTGKVSFVREMDVSLSEQVVLSLLNG